ncbi:unnamed protein product [Amoebophrya sp. A25]|nr:unnamed protein product [Amoebophrya sp. A25]|eukprot:GSA25T00001776001.1
MALAALSGVLDALTANPTDTGDTGPSWASITAPHPGSHPSIYRDFNSPAPGVVPDKFGGPTVWMPGYFAGEGDVDPADSVRVSIEGFGSVAGEPLYATTMVAAACRLPGISTEKESKHGRTLPRSFKNCTSRRRHEHAFAIGSQEVQRNKSSAPDSGPTEWRTNDKGSLLQRNSCLPQAQRTRTDVNVGNRLSQLL